MDNVKTLIPKDYAEKYKMYKSLEFEVKEMEALFKDKLVEMMENSNDMKAVEVDGLKFSFVKSSVRTTVDSKKLQEEEPEIYEKYLKETHVKSTYKTSILH